MLIRRRRKSNKTEKDVGMMNNKENDGALTRERESKKKIQTETSPEEQSNK